MIELPHPSRETNAGPPSSNSLFADNTEPAGLVTVAVGPYAERLPVGNTTVGEIRNRFRQRFDIDPRSLAIVDGNEVGDDTVVRTGQVLMFVHKSGEKGSPRARTPEAIDPARTRTVIRKEARDVHAAD
jgi:hypothetical protein